MQYTTLQDELALWVDSHNTTYYRFASEHNIPSTYIYRIRNSRDDKVPNKIKARIADALGLEYHLEFKWRDAERTQLDLVFIVYRVSTEDLQGE